MYFEPYTPAHHFKGGKQDPHFCTKLKIASQLVELAVGEGIPFRAVVADSFYGEDEGFKQSLSELEVGYVMALKPSHAWWHRVGEIGSPYEAAVAAGQSWEGERHPGDWVKVMQRFRDGHEEAWWALEVDVGPYGPQRVRRADDPLQPNAGVVVDLGGVQDLRHVRSQVVAVAVRVGLLAGLLVDEGIVLGVAGVGLVGLVLPILACHLGR